MIPLVLEKEGLRLVSMHAIVVVQLEVACLENFVVTNVKNVQVSIGMQHLGGNLASQMILMAGKERQNV
jgi:hypothetical protein